MSVDVSTLNGSDIGKRFRVTHVRGVAEGPLSRLILDYRSVEDRTLASAEAKFTPAGVEVTITVGGVDFHFEQTGHGFGGATVDRVES